MAGFIVDVEHKFRTNCLVEANSCDEAEALHKAAVQQAFVVVAPVLRAALQAEFKKIEAKGKP